MWLRPSHVSVSPYHIFMSFALRMSFSRFACPCARFSRHLIFIALCMPRLYLSCIHAYHAYCIVFGIGVSPGTGNELRFVLRVTERVSIPSHRHSGLPMMELGSCCVYTCIHSILSCTFRLLCHHASICVIGGTRIEACIYL